MKRLLIFGAIFTCMGILIPQISAASLQPPAAAAETGSCPTMQKSPADQNNEIGRQIRKAMELRKRMHEIEKQVIESDPELKQAADQIKTLSQQLNVKLKGKLQGNQEYQGLKSQLEQMRVEFRVRWHDRNPIKNSSPSPGN